MSDEGGFLKVGLTSPPLSTASSTITPSLPHPRNHSLISGSPKEANFIRFVNQSIDRIQKRYANRSGSDEPQLDENGYTSFKQAGEDFERLVDMVWVSGTPSLQITFLLSVAFLVQTYIPSLSPAPKTMFRLLDKLDVAFASLLQGRNIDSGEPLPGFETGKGVTGTEKVRIKSIADNSRVAVVHRMSKSHVEPESDVEGTDDAEASMEEYPIDDDLLGENDFAMNVARVYDRTTVELGDQLGGDATNQG
ncbi:hypothetical protein EV356DRAFT_501859 [Viridothelium virens]|uniref:Uncharacterized protein n=1 Tax=Viridothelium virens TaxID=1048519 RepID=A0A6A6H8I9_VIRVR|nr:hypothetical protein EV356DRAFT_501859 [Viridothelium virens]